jgi:hypothetical protein
MRGRLWHSPADTGSFAFSGKEIVRAPTWRWTPTSSASLLQDAVVYRNAWIGHGGVSGSRDQKGRLQVLEDLLAGVRISLGTAFDTWILLKPGPAAFTGGIFDLTATRIMGTRSLFRKEQVQVGRPLDTGRLYLSNVGSLKALELVPLIRIIAGQRTGEDACYFYNRLESNAVRWVSYHFQPEPEIVLADPEVIEFLSDLREK